MNLLSFVQKLNYDGRVSLNESVGGEASELKNNVNTKWRLFVGREY